MGYRYHFINKAGLHDAHMHLLTVTHVLILFLIAKFVVVINKKRTVQLACCHCCQRYYIALVIAA